MVVLLIRRLGFLAAGLLITSMVIFFVLRVLPGDVAQVIGGTTATEAQLALIRDQLGLDRPLFTQYLTWLGDLARFDLGNSMVTRTPVATELAQKFQVTAPLCLLGLTIALILALPLGIVAGLRHEKPSGLLIQFSSQLTAAVPALWAGLLLITVFARGFGLIPILPSQGFPRAGWDSPGAAMVALLLPALTIGIIEGAVVLRFVRSAVLDAMGQDHVRTAAAKGLTRTEALLRHGMPAVSLSIITVVGLQAASLITGAVLVEELFDLPGVGQMLVTAVGQRDLAKVQSVVFVMTAMVLVIGVILDVIYRVIDPRQRLGNR